MLEWNTKYFPLNLQSGLTLSNFRDVGLGLKFRNQIRHCKTVCSKRNLYLINYNRMRTQWTTKGNRDAGSSPPKSSEFRGVWTPQTPLGTPLVFGVSFVSKFICEDRNSSLSSSSILSKIWLVCLREIIMSCWAAGLVPSWINSLLCPKPSPMFDLHSQETITLLIAFRIWNSFRNFAQAP